MTEHALTPWAIVTTPVSDPRILDIAETKMAGGAVQVVARVWPRMNGPEETRANADFICLACNAHDWLMREVAETKALLAYIRQHAGECPADHPKLLAKMDALIARKPHEPQD